MCPRSQGHASIFAGAPIAQLEDVRLLGPTFLMLPAQAFYVKKAVVPAVAQMAPTYAAGGGGAEKLLGPYDVLDDHWEEVEVRTLVHLPYRFVHLALDQHRPRCSRREVLVQRQGDETVREVHKSAYLHLFRMIVQDVIWSQ